MVWEKECVLGLVLGSGLAREQEMGKERVSVWEGL
jgi:hypothetical protein